MEVTQVIRDGCQCDFQESFISQAVLLCDQQQPTQIVYRANITSFGNYSANHLLEFIEEWVSQGATIVIDVAIVTFDPDCPVRISGINDPVCSQTAIVPTSTSVVVTPTLTSGAPSTLALIAASVPVAVTIVAVTAVVIIILILCILNRKKQT